VCSLLFEVFFVMFSCSHKSPLSCMMYLSVVSRKAGAGQSKEQRAPGCPHLNGVGSIWRLSVVQEKMTRETPFSYNCLRCNACCHGKLIQVNPYEILKIANRLEISTSEVLSTYIMTDQPYLRQVENAACIFLGKDGCQIHSHRPTVCRIYPLGVRRQNLSDT